MKDKIVTQNSADNFNNNLKLVKKVLVNLKVEFKEMI